MSDVNTRIAGTRRKVCGVAAALTLLAASTQAQTTETPVPFDSAGRIRIITPAVATRLNIAREVWPVAAPYNEARLYTVSSGGFVIVVSQPNGTFIRYLLTSDQRASLSDAIMRAVRTTSADVQTAAAPSARNAFVRNQTLLTAAVYAPAAASLTETTKARTAVWLLSTGGSFFALTALTRNAYVSPAQNHLSTDGGARGALLTNLALHTFGVDVDNDIAITAGLGGAIGGATFGYKWGKHLTEGEASATTAGSTLVGLTALGLSAAFNATTDSSLRRAASGAVLAGALAGYGLGRQYVRHASYNVTPGDIRMMHVTGALGVAASLIPFFGADDVSSRSLGSALTAGLLTGTVIGDLVYTRKFDHTDSESWRVVLGAVAGGLVGGAALVLTDAEAQAGWSMVVSGSLLGTIITHKIVKPARDSKR